jgi:hypothetical protein
MKLSFPTGLAGVTSNSRSQGVYREPVPYSEDSYAQGYEFTAAELTDEPSVTDRLLGRLWRGVGSDFTRAELGSA